MAIRPAARREGGREGGREDIESGLQLAGQRSAYKTPHHTHTLKKIPLMPEDLTDLCTVLLETYPA